MVLETFVASPTVAPAASKVDREDLVWIQMRDGLRLSDREKIATVVPGFLHRAMI